MKIEYISKGGRLTMDKISALDGFGLPTKDYFVVEFAGENGATVTGKRDFARTMTVTGVVDGTDTNIQKIQQALYNDGVLYLNHNNTRRKINCRSVENTVIRIGKSNKFKITIQLVADYPYFNDYYDTEVALYKRINRVKTTFTLPCVLTDRISRANVVNRGDKSVYPTLTITNTGDTTSNGNSLIVINHTTDSTITINHELQQDEVITIDLATRQITSDISGNITTSLSDDTVLSSFYFDVGTNDIEFINNDSNTDIQAVVTYNHEYLIGVVV